MRISVIFAAAAALLCAACGQLQTAAAPPEFNGAYAIIEADPSALAHDHLERMSNQVADVLRAADINYVGRGVADGVLRIRLERTDQTARAVDALAPITGHLIVSPLSDGVIEARVSDDYFATLANEATANSVEVIRRRVARFRPPVLVEPYGPGKIIVRTTEAVMPDLLLFSITQRGQIAFHMVKELPPEDHAAGRIPPGTMFVQPYAAGSGTREVVERRARITGHIAQADPRTDSMTGEFVVSFRFDAEGARAFCSITSGHTGERFAVLLDNRVVTAPRINEPICGGAGQISGNFTAESANEMAIILRAGALPLPFTLTTQGVGEPPAAPIAP